MEVSNLSIVAAYSIYLPIAILLTYFVARTLFKNSKVFMLDIFRGREEIADSTNKLFQLGFYLLNLGFALLILRISYYGDIFTTQDLIEILSHKIGGFSIYLGVMLFLNLMIFFRGKRKTKQAIHRDKMLETHQQGLQGRV
tara:strand:+ start:17 stop:439 length:423 start_codon:yes stop_codon:yes gene_type:complete